LISRHVGRLIVSVLALSVVDREFVPPIGSNLRIYYFQLSRIVKE